MQEYLAVLFDAPNESSKTLSTNVGNMDFPWDFGF